MERHRGERSGGHADGGRGSSRHHPYDRHNNSRTSSRTSFSSSRDDDDYYPNHQRQSFPRDSGVGEGPPSGNRYPPNDNFPMQHGPIGGGGGRSARGGMRQGSGFDDSPPSDYFSGQKRPYGGLPVPGGGLSRRGPSPDSADTGTFAKLFVGSVPRTAREEDIRPLFEEYGNVLEVALIKDKRTGQQQADWWNSFGQETPHLKNFAIRVLNLTCSASGCERNWSTFSMVHSKRRNRLQQEKMNALVFVMYNMKLRERHIKRSAHQDPIRLDHIDSDDEWIVEREEPTLPTQPNWLNESWLDENFDIPLQEPTSVAKEGGNEVEGSSKVVAYKRRKVASTSKGCCFVKYATSEEADRAIRGLHNQCTLPGGVGPIQVRYADGERERLGAAEYKLFVGSLNKQATEKEIEEIFSPFGRVEDVYIMRDDLKQSRGCGFIKYSYREMASAAIDALNGKFIMRGCDQPLIVRFADPKRPKGDSRGGPAFGGPGFGQRPQLPAMNRPMPSAGGPTGFRMPDNSWHPMSPENMGMQLSHVSSGAIGGQGPRGGGAVPSGAAGVQGLSVRGPGGANGSLLGPALAPITTSQQGLNPPLMQAQLSGQPLSPSQKSLSSPQQMPSLQLQHIPSAYAQQPSSLTSLPFSQALHTPLLMNQQAFDPRPSSLKLVGSNGHLSSSQTNAPQITSAASIQPIPSSPQVQGGAASAPHTQLGLIGTQKPQMQAHQPSPGQQPLALVQQQAQTSHLSFQSPQHAFSQLQQQLHLAQTTSHGQLASQPIKQQLSWAGAIPQTIASTTVATPVNVSSTITSTPLAPVSTKVETPVTCDWTEHTSPDEYKYYYNSVTRESRWEKPEELTLFEQKQQKTLSQLLQAQAQVQPQVQSPQVSHSQQPQPQAMKLQPVEMQLQQPASVSSYPASGVIGQQNIQGLSYMQQMQAASSATDHVSLQQMQALAAQEWMWKNKPAGN